MAWRMVALVNLGRSMHRSHDNVGPRLAASAREGWLRAFAMAGPPQADNH
jgi:hypothetical protein